MYLYLTKRKTNKFVIDAFISLYSVRFKLNLNLSSIAQKKEQKNKRKVRNVLSTVSFIMFVYGEFLKQDWAGLNDTFSVKV